MTIRDDLMRIANAPVKPQPVPPPPPRLPENIARLAAEVAAGAYTALRGEAFGRDAGHQLAYDFALDVEDVMRLYLGELCSRD